MDKELEVSSQWIGDHAASLNLHPCRVQIHQSTTKIGGILYHDNSFMVLVSGEQIIMIFNCYST